MKTKSIPIAEITKNWIELDANGIILGKLASKAAHFLIGKHKTKFTPHMDDGDNVIVINAEKIRLTGEKAKNKVYYHHTGYMGHIKETSFQDMLAKHPHRVIEKAVFGMLPKNKLGRKQYTHLFVYAGNKHKHTAQNPKKINII